LGFRVWNGRRLPGQGAREFPSVLLFLHRERGWQAGQDDGRHDSRHSGAHTGPQAELHRRHIWTGQ